MRLLEFTNTQQQMPPICISEFDFFQHKGWRKHIEYVEQKIQLTKNISLYDSLLRNPPIMEKIDQYNDLILQFWNALSPRVTLLQNKRMPIWRLRILGKEK